MIPPSTALVAGRRPLSLVLATLWARRSDMTETTAEARTALGRYGEDVAERFLREQGMVVLDRNWRCAEGELDLVLREGEVLVACEVKTRDRKSTRLNSSH